MTPFVATDIPIAVSGVLYGMENTTGTPEDSGGRGVYDSVAGGRGKLVRAW